MTWSPTDIDTGIKASLIQSYPILLATLLSIKRCQLTFGDAYWALLVTFPPVMVYLVFSSICDLLGAETSIYKRIQSHPHITRAFGVLILPIWLALSLTFALSSQAFKGSEESGGWTFQHWLSFLVHYTLGSVVFGYGGWYPALIIATFFSLFLFRRRSQVVAGFQAYQERESKPWGRWYMPWVFVMCAW